MVVLASSSSGLRRREWSIVVWCQRHSGTRVSVSNNNQGQAAVPAHSRMVTFAGSRVEFSGRREASFSESRNKGKGQQSKGKKGCQWEAERIFRLATGKNERLRAVVREEEPGIYGLGVCDRDRP
jgi:hypothetical protein